MPTENPKSLQYLDTPLLTRLVNVDNDLMAERAARSSARRADGTIFAVLSLSEIATDMTEEARPAFFAANALSTELTDEQVAEAVALLNIARGVSTARSLHKETAKCLKQKYARSYVRDKTGFGYFSTAVEKLGLHLRQVH